MADTPLPEPESEQPAALVGSGSIRLVYGLLHRRQRNPPTPGEIGLFLQAAASADTSAARALRYLKDYFDIATVTAQGEERYQLRGWAGTQASIQRPAGKFAPPGRVSGPGSLRTVWANTDATRRSAQR
jgi:hypothetical protein